MFTFSAYPSISFWEVTKNMLFPNAGHTPPQEQEKKDPPAKDDDQQQQVTRRNANLIHDVT